MKKDKARKNKTRWRLKPSRAHPSYPASGISPVGVLLSPPDLSCPDLWALFPVGHVNSIWYLSIPGQSPTFWKSPLHTKKSHSFMCGLLRNSWGESNSAGYHPVSSVFWNLGGSLQESLILTSQNHKKSAIWAMQSSAAIWGMEPDPLEPQVQNSLCIWKTWFLGNLLL